MSATLVGALVGAGCGLLTTPYLARLSLSVPDREDHTWWRGQPAGRTRTLLTGLSALALGALAGAAAGWDAALPALIALALLVTPLVVIDFEQHRLPNRLVFAAGGAGLVLFALAAGLHQHWWPYLRAIEGGAAVYAVLYVLWFISPRSFGFGDVKLGGALGGYLGWFGWIEVYYGIFAGFLLGGLVAMGLLTSGRAGWKTHMAFGPTLILGAILVMAVRSVLP